MTYFVLHIDGKLVGVTKQLPDIDLPGISYIEVEGNIPNLNIVTWNTELLIFEYSFADKLSKYEFNSRFNSYERIAIRTSTDPLIMDYLELLKLTEEINLSNPNTRSGVYYLANSGYITWERAEEILRTEHNASY